MKSIEQLEMHKKLLVEKFGNFMEKQENLAPIAARIFATLFIDKENGETFEELVNFLGASKSTISTNLNHLTKAGMIVYHTKPGDRKKYYTLSPVGFLARLEEKVDQYKTEHQLVEEIIVFKSKSNQITADPEKIFQQDNESPYLDFLANTITLLEQLRDQIKTKCSISNTPTI
ncbi:GbsR/MarR family transcriptional regulator [Ancylomarina longa]|uniref:ArsR family transcriptional regulator n=1 Tax=Ancylomarina longa TaxID=2487017 RepID=A0A434AXA5_9BACT|nr:winged helix-turn-helix domain-containing protein [Ancylomarina longa]RUT79161.1 ArsR family transcriptional regulator [Ancylomarina longa]